MSELLLEPLKYYELEGREKHKQNVRAYFEELKTRSGVDATKNKRTVSAYKSSLAKAEKLGKRVFWKKLLRVFLFILAGVGLILTVVGIASEPLCIPIGVLLLAAPLLLIFLWLNKGIRQVSELLEKEKKTAEELLATAWQEMAPLNALFHERDAITLIEKTMPTLCFDAYYGAERERELRERCAYEPEYDENRSVIDTLSGEYKENPFLFERHLIHRIGEETYHGTLTISWTETYRDSKGNRQIRRRTQTLHASVVKPKPFYHVDTVLKYFPQGAPDLSFTREGLYHDDKSEKQIARLVKKGEKKLKKKAAKALETGGSFTEMNNTEFEVLFDALNRDHEVQFRMMFTPLAQNNMVDLMRSETGYGDDFDFYKLKRMTVIHSDHAQAWAMDASVSHYRSYDFEEIEKKFNAFHQEYFKSVFFDFAPLLAIPMYQDKPVKSLEPLKEYRVNYTANEYETLANRMEQSLLVHRESGTRAILKARGVTKEKDADSVEIRAFSYRTEPRIDLVPVLGGDGRWHSVPVHWTEFIPVMQTSHLQVKKEVKSENLGNDTASCHGLVAKLFAG